ncbi:ASKHA domain-containing protein [Desulfosporosinus orientis]|uniref:ASKHA domain-containing protein n=1 Tax=Desulfosporosinus orientis TaxID=1563 RepID=UPI0003113D3D|nr:ASKHA domain-containing protein [Desulfosporosinus orientis]
MQSLKRIKFLPHNVEVFVPAGTTVVEAADLARVEIEPTPCGRRGTCGKCLILCRDYSGSPTIVEEEKITNILLEQGWRLACQTTVVQDMIIEVPSQAAGKLIKDLLSRPIKAIEVLPSIIKYYIKVAPPTMTDQRSDWDRVESMLPDPEVQQELDLNLLRELPELVRNNNYEITVVTYKGKVISLEAGDTTSVGYGCAIDIGTTTIICSLHDLYTGQEISVASAFNPQRTYGADVLSRIDFSRKDGNLEKLQNLIVGQVNTLIEKVIESSGISCSDIYLISVVGNTTMQHLFLGLPVRYIATPPFVGTLYTGLSFNSQDLGIKINKRGKVAFLPNVAGYVGADIVAGVLATGAYNYDAPCILIDVGTNAEIVLAAHGRLYACSAAAGPAFEGANICYGMRAETGAIDQVWLEDGMLHYHVIGEVPALGLCGSGLVDVIAVLLGLGIIDSSGRLLSSEEAIPLVGEKLAESLFESDDGDEFILVKNSECQKVSLTQRDIRQVQLAKGAILAGIRIMIKEMSLNIEDIEQFNIAGSFGNVLDKKNAQAVGLIPAAIPLSKVKYAGNSAHIGAQMNLLRADTEEIVNSLVKNIKYLELSDRSDFTEEFTNAMFFADCAE